MNLESSESDQSNQLLSVLEMKQKHFRENTEDEEISIDIMRINDTQFRGWAISVGAIRLRECCDRCNAKMKIEREKDRNEIWYCSSVNLECETFRTDKKFCFDFDKPMSDLIEILFAWYKNQNSEQIITENGIVWEDYNNLDKILTDVCIMKCIEGSRMIGGSKTRINVEIGRRRGLENANKIVICGVCENNDDQYFFVVLNHQDPSYLEVEVCLANWVRPNSIIFTNTDGFNFIDDMKWNKNPVWPLTVKSECLARDLWIHIHRHLPNMFEEFILDVLEYSNHFA